MGLVKIWGCSGWRGWRGQGPRGWNDLGTLKKWAGAGVAGAARSAGSGGREALPGLQEGRGSGHTQAMLGRITCWSSMHTY